MSKSILSATNKAHGPKNKKQVFLRSRAPRWLDAVSDYLVRGGDGDDQGLLCTMQAADAELPDRHAFPRSSAAVTKKMECLVGESTCHALDRTNRSRFHRSKPVPAVRACKISAVQGKRCAPRTCLPTWRSLSFSEGSTDSSAEALEKRHCTTTDAGQDQGPVSGAVQDIQGRASTCCTSMQLRGQLASQTLAIFEHIIRLDEIHFPNKESYYTPEGIELVHEAACNLLFDLRLKGIMFDLDQYHLPALLLSTKYIYGEFCFYSVAVDNINRIHENNAGFPSLKSRECKLLCASIKVKFPRLE
jgi:hypothetical protein